MQIIGCFSLLRGWVKPNRREKGCGWIGLVQRVNLVSGWEETLVCSATNKITLRLGRHAGWSRYTPILFPAEKGLWTVELRTSLHSGWEEVLQGQSPHEFSLWLGKNMGALQYQPDLSHPGIDLAVLP